MGVEDGAIVGILCGPGVEAQVYVGDWSGSRGPVSKIMLPAAWAMEMAPLWALGMVRE